MLTSKDMIERLQPLANFAQEKAAEAFWATHLLSTRGERYLVQFGLKIGLAEIRDGHWEINDPENRRFLDTGDRLAQLYWSTMVFQEEYERDKELYGRSEKGAWSEFSNEFPMDVDAAVVTALAREALSLAQAA